MLCTASWWW